MTTCWAPAKRGSPLWGDRKIRELLNILGALDKPARYVGGEINEIRKDWDSVEVRFALAFPDMYEVAMSHLGLHILYHTLNGREDTLCERTYAVWPDLEAELRRRRQPLFTLESKRPLGDFDIVGFTIQYELCYPTVLAMLDLAGIPIHSRDRRDSDPIIIGGGPGAFNPESVANFFDAFLVGEGEDAVHEIVEVVRDNRSRGRGAVLEALAYVGGVYVPRFFEPVFDAGRLVGMKHDGPGPAVIRKRIIADLNDAPFPDRPLVANVEAVHDRVAVELQRGCMRACRFCQVGYIARPNRQRSPQQVFDLASRGLEATGKEKVGFLSLSAGDYGCLNPLLEDFFRRFAPEMVGASLPSLRTETLTPQLADQLKRVRKSGFTIAPEAGSARMRRVVNKGNDEEDLLKAVLATFGAGWKLIKMYFMIGLPFERDEDVEAIADLCKRALSQGRKLSSNARIVCSASTFVPKPHTPFQFASMIHAEETRRRHAILSKALRGTAIDFKRHEPAESVVEGLLSRADRRMGGVIERVFRAGGRLDGWSEHFHQGRWLEGMAAEGLSVEEALGPRSPEDYLPWDHIDCLMPKDWMWRDYQDAKAEVFIDDCALAPKPRCYDCGVCDHQVIKNRIHREGDYSVTLPSEAAPAWQPAADEPEASSVQPQRVPGRTFRLHYFKKERAALFGHLDTMRVLERAFRRAGLAPAYTRGFNPRPRMIFAPACPLGVESEAEYLDLELRDDIEAEEVGERLHSQLPLGFELHCVREIDPKGVNISAAVEAFVLRLEFPEALSPGDIEARVEAFHAASKVLVQRRRKKAKRSVERELDLKVLVPELVVTGPHRARAVVRAGGQEGAARPNEILGTIFGLSAPVAAEVRLVREKAVLAADAEVMPLLPAAQAPGEDLPIPESSGSRGVAGSRLVTSLAVGYARDRWPEEA